jgi:bacterioferritin (cytochrome b1)
MGKEKLLKEDQKFLSGVDSYVDWMKRTVPVQMSLKDILGMDRKGQDNPNPLYPHNMQNIEQLLADAVELNRSIRTQLEAAQPNPIIKNDKLKTHVLKKLLKKNEEIIEAYDKMLKDIPYMTLDN